MADRIITAEALITAKDGTGDVFSKIASKFQQLGKGANVSKDIEKMAASLEKAQSQLRALEKTQGARSKFADARAQFNAHKTAVEAASKALANAEKPTRELEAAYKRAQVAVSKASTEFERQKTALLDAKHAAESFGAPLGKIASEQARLKGVIESTTAAIEKQGAAELKAAETATKAASAHRALEAAREKRAHGIAHHGIVNYALGSAAMAVSAHSIFHVGEKAIEAGAEFQHERVASANAGRSPAEIKAYGEAAKRAALSIPTASYTESMKTALETTSAFGSVEHAIDHLNFMMRTAAVLKAASGGKIAGGAGEMGQKFAKFFEMRGVAGDPKRFESEGNEMVRAMAFSGGTFNPNEMFNFAQQAKSALRNYDVNYLSRVVPSLVGETGGERAGTGANAFYNVLMGKANDAKQAAEWQKYGLLDPKQVIEKSGKVVAWRAGAVKDTDTAMRNPLEWFEKTVLPAMQAKGVKVEDTKELSKVLATMFRNSMSNMFANENAQLADRTRLHKDARLIDQTEHPEDMYKRNLSEDPTQAVEALKASFNSLSAAVTSPAMKSAAGVITGLSFALTRLSASAMDHPVTSMTLGAGVGAAALGGAGYMSYQVMNGFGLGASATALDGSAAALTGAAAALKAAAGAGEVANLAEGAAGGLGGKAKTLSRFGKVLKTVPLIATAAVATSEAIDFLNEDKKEHPEKYRGRSAAAYRPGFAGSAAHHILFDPDGFKPDPGRQSFGPFRHWADPVSSGRGRPAMPGHWSLDQTPHPALAGPGLGQSGPVTAEVKQPIPVDVTGKVKLEGQGTVSVSVKVDGGTVTNTSSSSSGNIKVSTGASMPTAAAATGSSAPTVH